MLAEAAVPRWLAIFALAASTGLAYLNAAPRALVHDDNTALVQNPRFGGVERIPELFSEPVWEGVQGNRRLYRPLAMATLALDRTVFGGEPRGYHLTSIVLHILATLVLFGFLEALGAGRLGAFLAALLFGVHPIHTEAVAVAFNRSEVLACIGVLGALWWLWTWLGTRPRLAWAGAALFYLLALLSRESAVTLPVLAALGLLLLQPASAGPTRLRDLAPLLLLAMPLALYLWLRQSALGEEAGGIVRSLGAEGIGGSDAPGKRLALVAATLRDYWRMLVFPWPLRASYEDYVLRGVGVAVALHATLLGIGVAARRRAPALSLGIGFFYLVLLPSTRLFADPAVLAERFVYLPSAGMAIPLGFGFAWLARRAGPRRALAVGVLLAGLLAPLTLLRNQAWRSREALWEAEARAAPRDWRALLNLSQVRVAQGRHDDALALCDRGLNVAPWQSAFHTNRGVALVSLGRIREAEAAFRSATESGDAGAHANLARLYATTGRQPLAEEAYRRALAREPDAAARLALEGEMLLYCRDDAAGARTRFESALASSPALAAARLGLRRLEEWERNRKRERR